MARDLSHEEARQEAMHELTGKHYYALRAKLQGGNAELVDAIDQTVLAALPNAFWREVIISAAHGHFSTIGARFAKLVEVELLTRAEAEARKEVEQMEKQRAESQEEAKADLVLLDRAMDQ